MHATAPFAAPLPRCHALVPCAGVGERAAAGGPKQYAPLAGQAVVAHTLRALLAVPELTSLWVIVAPQDYSFGSYVPADLAARVQVRRVGGASRATTVANGLQAMAEQGVSPEDWVLVHDAARCLLQPAWVQRLIHACQVDAVGGLLALPVADTLKAAKDERSQRTVDRSSLWAAQTPQMFRLGMLADALQSAGAAVTDESSAIEALGLQPKLVRGDARNLKITWPEDFALAEQLLKAAP